MPSVFHSPFSTPSLYMVGSNVTVKTTPPPETIMEPPKKRQRPLTKACEACKVRKAKCDSETPCCGTCRRKGTECVYREREQPGLRAGYGKSLDERLSRMESSLHQIQRTLVDLPLPSSQRQLDPDGEIPIGVNEVDRDPLPQDGHFQDTPVQLHEGPLKTVSSTIGDLTLPNHQEHAANGLPPQYMIDGLVDLYFELVNPWMNILDRQHFEAHMLSPERLLVLHGVILVTLRYWNQPEPDPMVRQQYMESCREKILSSAMETISLASAQALTFLAFDALGQGPSARMLNVMALLNTAIAQLDLARERCDRSDNRSVSLTRLVRKQLHEDEQDHTLGVDEGERSRLFWAVYTLDRIVSVSHGVDCRMSPNFFRRTLEATDEAPTPQGRIEALRSDVELKSANAGLTGSWQLFIQATTLMERVNEFLLKPVDLCDAGQCREWKRHFRALDSALCAWSETLPPANQSVQSDGFDGVWTTAMTTYYTAVIRMQSVAAFPPRTCHYFSASPLAPGRCHEAVKRISSICESIIPHNLSKLGPLFVFSVWVAARNMIVLWTTGWEERSPTVPSELTVLRNVLREMSRHWLCAQKYVSMIDFAVDSNDEANEHSVLAVFNDVSKTAYGLHNVLEPRIRHDMEAQLAQLWEWVDIPGLAHDIPLTGDGGSVSYEL